MTIDGDTKLLAQPFLVMAKQNPIDSWDLPADQRPAGPFASQIRLGYRPADEEKIIKKHAFDNLLDQLTPF